MAANKTDPRLPGEPLTIMFRPSGDLADWIERERIKKGIRRATLVGNILVDVMARATAGTPEAP